MDKRPGPLAVIFERLGPYHHARLRATGTLGEVVGLECYAQDDVYAWDHVIGEDGFTRITLAQTAADHTMTGKLVGELSRIRPCAVAIPGWSDKAALAALAWCLKARVPVVIMSESTAQDRPRSRWKEAIKRAIVRLCSAALVGGKLHADYLRALGLPHERIFTGYDIVDNAHFEAGAAVARGKAVELRRELGLPEFFFLASSRFVEKKNLPRLLNAYAKYLSAAGARAWSLVLLGDGPLRPQLEAQSKALRLESYVHLPGFKQYHQLPAYYGLASAFIHASTTEQWGLVVNEALAAGLPVLVSKRCGCLPDLVEEGGNGFGFDPYNEDMLTARLLKLSSGECDLSRMGRRSSEIIRSFSPQCFGRGMWAAVQAGLAAPLPCSRLTTRVWLTLAAQR